MTERQREVLRSKIRGCFAGIINNDALGMSVESMSHEEILIATDGKGITGFVDPLQSKIKGLMNYKAGQPTDDWQLNRAVAKSLIECGKIDWKDIARKQIAELEIGTGGWGRTTKDGLLEIKHWFQTSGREGRAPDQPATKGGCGNGVAMKVAPLAIVLRLRNRNDVYSDYENWFKDILTFGMMTHPDPRASMAALAVAIFIDNLLMPNFTVTKDNGMSLMSSLVIDQMWSFVRVAEYDLPKMIPGYKKDMENAFSTKLIDLYVQRKLHKKDDFSILREAAGTQCFAMESVTLAIGIALRHMDDFRAGAIEAVNAGGDADTIASMVGGMIGANVGLEGIPEEWRNFSPDFQEAIDLADQLFDRFAVNL